jgi:DNA-binding MarR family transcriptional regulator
VRAKRELLVDASRSRDSLEPGSSPGFLLWRVTLRWQRLMAAALRPFGVTHVQFVLLASLWWLSDVRRESPSQRRLAEFAGTDEMMTSQVVRALDARGLVDRAADPQDARARRLKVTARGAELARTAVAAVEAADRDFFAPAGNVERVLEILQALDA